MDAVDADGPAATALDTWIADRRRWGTGWRRLIFPGIFLVYLAQTVSGLRAHTDGVWTIIGCAGIAVFCVAYLVAAPATMSGFVRRTQVGFGTMVAMFALLVPLAHEDAFPMLVFILVIVIGVRGQKALPLVGACVVAVAVVPMLIPAWHHPGVDFDAAFTTALVTLAMFGFFGVARSSAALAVANADIAQLAAENERNRIARDLHDLLGHSLTSITVKAELARRLSATDPQRAAAEIAEVEELSRRTLAEVRVAVVQTREVTLTNELASAREVLRSAGVAPDFPSATDIVDPDCLELFGWVVRESVTNIVRYARATVCTVTFGPRSIEVSDNGVGVPWSDSPPPGAGQGLIGLRQRVEGAGGTFEAGPAGSCGWRVRAEVPPRPGPTPLGATDVPSDARADVKAPS